MKQRYQGLVFATFLAVALLSLLWQVNGTPLQAAWLFAGEDDPTVQAVTVTASIPIWDTQPGSKVDREVYFNNQSTGVLTLTFAINGTPQLALQPGAAFADTPATLTSAQSPWDPTITYTVGSGAANQPGVTYTAVNTTGATADVILSYVQDTTGPFVALVQPAGGYVSGTVLSMSGIAADIGVGLDDVHVTAGSTWVTADGSESWSRDLSMPLADGVPYTLQAKARDHLGTWGVTASRAITLDNQAPAGTVVFTPSLPLDQPVSTPTLSLRWSGFTDGSGIRRYGYLVTTENGGVALPTEGATFTDDAALTEVLADGVYYAYVAAQDMAGNWGATEVVGPFRVDGSAPSVAITTPGAGAVFTQEDLPSVSIAGTATDNRAVTDVEVKTDAAWVPATGSETWSYIWDLPLTDETTYQLSARAYDAAGNVGNATPVSVVVDTVAPVGDTPQPAQSPWVADTVIYDWDDAVDAAGIQAYQIQITNTAGFSQIWTTALSQFTFTEAQAEGEEYVARVRVTDNHGNSGAWSGWSTAVTPDLTAPTLLNPYIGAVGDSFCVSMTTKLFYTNTFAFAQSFTVGGNAADAGSGLDRATFPTAFGYKPPNDMTPGAFAATYDIAPDSVEGGTIAVTVYDKVGNHATQTYSYALDGTPPESSAWSPPVATGTEFGVTWVITDTQCGGGGAELWFKEEGGTWQVYDSQTGSAGTFDFTASGGDGTYSFAIRAYDGLGNWEPEPTMAETSTIVDTTLPRSEVTDAPTYARQQPIQVTWVATPSLAPITEVRLWYRIDGGIWTSTSITSAATQGTFNFDPDDYGGQEGNYEFLTVAKDEYGKSEPEPTSHPGEASTIYDVSIDPPVSLTASPGDWTATNLFTITWSNPADLSGIVGAYYKLGSAPSSGTDGTWVTGSSFTVSVPGEGSHTLWLWLKDAAGNVNPAKAQSVVLKYDPSVEAAQNLRVEPGDWTATNSFAVRWTNPPDDSGIADAYYKLGSAPVPGTAGIKATGNPFTVNVPDDGEHTLWLWLEDEAGNIKVSKAQPVTLKYDATAPTLSLTVTDHISQTEVPLTWLAEDATSGVVSYKLEYSSTAAVGWHVLLADTTVTDYVFRDAQAETTYEFRVTAYDAAGNADSRTARVFVGAFRVHLPLTLGNYDPLYNGRFDSGLDGWTRQGTLPVSVVSAFADHNGVTTPNDDVPALLLGNPDYGCGQMPYGVYAGVAQSFVVADDVTKLKFDYVVWSEDASVSNAYDRFEVYVESGPIKDAVTTEPDLADGNKVNAGLDCGVWRRVPDQGWTTGEIDIEEYQGQRITVYFQNHSRFDRWYNTYTYLDNVRVE